nr:hypothetical protein JVH1_0697 [Rhodococcus sp. JVH1]
MSGFAYTAFVIDAFAGTIVGWEVSTSKETAIAAGGEPGLHHADDAR